MSIVKLKAFIIGCVLLFGVVPGLFILGIGMYTGGTGPIADCDVLQGSGGEANISGASDTAPSGLTVKDVPISDEQWRNAKVIVNVGIENGLSPRTAGKIAVATAMQEATLRNIPYGYPGSTSVGLFQQIAAWGPYRDRMNPRKSAYMFYFGGQQGQRGLTDVPGWENMSPGDAAQEVQQSGFPDAYDQHMLEAEAIVEAITGGDAGVETAAQYEECIEDLNPMEEFVRAALSFEGESYEWDDPNGSGLIAEAASRAGFTLPDSLSELKSFNGNGEEGVEATYLTTREITDSESLQRGDIVFYSTDDDADPEKVGVELGSGGSNAGTSFRIATYNVHTGLGRLDRVKRAHQIIRDRRIDITGFQELELRDAYQAMASGLGGQYGIYPEPSPHAYRHHLNARAIVYDKTRFELYDSDYIAFDRMKGERPDQPNHIPVIWLRDRATGQEFVVINTHSTAYARFAKERYDAGLAYVAKIKEIRASGLPVFFVGDFNSGYGLRDSINITYGNVRKNLTYCQLTAGDLMRNARDVLEGLDGYCPRNPAEGGGPVDHIYVSPGVQVESFSEIGRAVTTTDHPVLVADVRVPRSASDGLRIGSYNVLGSNHTSDASADRRIKTTARFIEQQKLGVVGLQELRPDQRGALLRLTGYEIFPKQPMYGAGAVSVNSIIWDPSRYELTANGGELVPMKYYFGKQPTDIPRVKLRDIVSGQEFYVTNTHDPAKAQYAELRYLNALAHEQQMDALASQGLPMFFTGDFNSGFGLRSPPNGNVTYEGKRENLTWCIMTRSGTMRNAYDANKGRTGACPERTTRELGQGVIDHVYVSSDVNVKSYEVVRKRTASDHPVVVVEAEFGPGLNGPRDKKWSSTLVTKVEDTVGLESLDTRKVVGVLRLTVTEKPDDVEIVNVSGQWAPPMKKGTYTLPSDGGDYGWRIHPIRGTQDFHNGIDLGAVTGARIYSIGDGKVVKAYYDSCWGNLVIIDHGDHLSMYTHLSSFAIGLSIPGFPVRAGQYIGAVGDTGACSAGSHLHFTVGTSMDILYGEQAGSVDPVPFMRERGITF